MGVLRTIFWMLVISGIALVCALKGMAAAWVIKAQTYAVEGTTGYNSQKIAFERLEKATKGELKVELYGSNAIVQDFQMFEACQKGILHAIHLPGAFASKADPGFSLIFSMPGLWERPTDVRVWLEGYGGTEIVKAAYEKFGLVWVGPTFIGAEPIFSKVRIGSLSDFKGKKIRTPAGVTSMLFERLGARPVNLPGGELYSAMQTGVVDMLEFVTLAENYYARLHEVSRYILWPSFHGPIAEVDWVFNRQMWEQLPTHLKEAFKQAVYECDYRYEIMSAAADMKALDEMKKKGLVHVMLSPSDMEKAKQISREVVLEFARKSELSSRVVNSVLNYLKAIGRLQ